MWEGLLPIGSIVKLENFDRLVMIMGVWAIIDGEEENVIDYSGVIYPEGYINKELTLAFDRDKITDVLYIGYMDDQQKYLMDRVEPLLDGIKSGELSVDEALEMASQIAADEDMDEFEDEPEDEPEDESEDEPENENEDDQEDE
ncbi:DUF4176 domain-containing protein [Butyrivibrio sp. XPD2002]|uniref:DUF4176 domain-containing protein n=1 Tax=Butyrivibrio sp. XPD2002 TaxID=1280665 RepID=UPI0004161477|nr:DUF4176 domain-containing protein [Butyrivibrio sp. XPD2002]